MVERAPGSRLTDAMSPAWVALVTVLVGAYLLVHLATIATARLPWFDDTFFSSVTDALLHTGELRLRAAPLWLDKPVYLYGPVYFLALGGVFDQFGLGIVQARILGVLFGFAILAVCYLILRAVRVAPGLAFLATAALGLDPTFHQNVHAGRMDSMALCLLLLAFYLLLVAGQRQGRSAALWTAASAISAALGVLTTPRPGYLLVPLGLLLLLRWLRQRDAPSAGRMLLWGTLCAFFGGAWVVWAFGSIPGMLAYYGSFSDTYASGGFGVRALHAPILVPLAILFAVVAVLRPRLLGHELVIFTLAGIAGFYLFVKDKGTFGGLYSFFMVPMAYLLLGFLLARLREALASPRAARWVPVAVFGLLFAFNGGIFAARITLEYLQRASRDPAHVDALVKRLIPPGSRVVGDDKFYFAVKRADSDFQYAQRGGTVDERARYHKFPYDMDYLITAEGDTSELLRAYRGEVPLVEIATISSPPDGELARTIDAVARWAGIGTSLTASYDGRLFARSPDGAEPPSVPAPSVQE